MAPSVFFLCSLPFVVVIKEEENVGNFSSSVVVVGWFALPVRSRRSRRSRRRRRRRSRHLCAEVSKTKTWESKVQVHNNIEEVG